MTKQNFNEVRLYIPLDDGFSTWGTCDRLTIYNGTHALLGDYKTGVGQIEPPATNLQAKAYTLGVFEAYPDVREVTFVFYIPFYNDSPSHTFKREEVSAIRREITDVVKDATRVRTLWERAGGPAIEDLRPTQNCRFCRHEDQCPALGGLVVGVARKLGYDLPDVDFNTTEDPDTVELLYNIAKIVGNWSDTFRRRAVELAKTGVTFPTLRLKSLGATSSFSDNHEAIQLARAHGAVDEDILGVVNVPVGKLADLVSSYAPRGKKAVLRENFLAECEEKAIVTKSDVRYTLG